MQAGMMGILATCCLAASAHAQTSLQMYGIADLGVEWISHVPPAQTSQLRVSPNGETGSRLGLRGSTQLGDGWRAVFQLESGLTLDDGNSAQPGRLFGRTDYVGIEHDDAGQFSFGRHQNIATDFGIAFDPLGRASRYSDNSLDLGYVSRTDHAVKYIGRFGSAYTSLMYSPGDALGAVRTGRYGGALAGYQWDQIKLGLGMESVAGTAAATSGDRARRTMLGAGYALNATTKLGAGYTWRSNRIAGVASSIGQSWIGFQSTPAPAWYLAGTLYMAKLPNGGGDSRNLTLMLSYWLSRRTDLYLTTAHAWNRGHGDMGVTAFGTVAPGTLQNAVMTGICHQF